MVDIEYINYNSLISNKLYKKHNVYSYYIKLISFIFYYLFRTTI